MAKGDPASSEDEGDNGSANQDGLKDLVSLIVGVAHAVSQRREEGKATANDERKATDSGPDPTRLWCWCRNRLTLWLCFFWCHIHAALETPNVEG